MSIEWDLAELGAWTVASNSGRRRIEFSVTGHTTAEDDMVLLSLAISSVSAATETALPASATIEFHGYQVQLEALVDMAVFTERWLRERRHFSVVLANNYSGRCVVQIGDHAELVCTARQPAFSVDLLRNALHTGAGFLVDDTCMDLALQDMLVCIERIFDVMGRPLPARLVVLRSDPSSDPHPG